MSPKSRFGRGLHRVRKAAGLTQEAFGGTSSRTYVSALERELKSPTLEKIEELAETIGCHPLTLLVFAYVEPQAAPAEIAKLLEFVSIEIARFAKGTSTESLN
ncbi:helix-turn-helix domain-containing protein [Chitinolyticbacter albus]|uniref:helix-turn-helix domain-containing protein n=1 Tax=Chitinolyticbacter albus TaxID=2961951 RepID=UPI00210EB61D|nr:helix-turn-helix transcriptional regulator [Chitinolyticbacter albus]